MQLTGSLDELTWPLLLHTLDHMQLPGLLSVQTRERSPYHIWINHNAIVAVSRQLNGQGLLWLIHQQGTMCFYSVNRLAKRCPSSLPLGLYLKSQKILTDSHLQELFQKQVMHTLYELVQQKSGTFCFESQVAIAHLEMTGLHLPIYDLWMASLAVSCNDIPINENSVDRMNENQLEYSSLSLEVSSIA